MLASRSVRCAFCAARLIAGEDGWVPAPAEHAPEPLRHPTMRRLWLGGHRYALLGRLARGEGSDVFLAERDGRLTERVVLKILRAEKDRDLLEREHAVLAELEKSDAQGAAHFTRLLPQRVALGVARLGMHGEAGERHVSALRWRSGFVHTGDDVIAAYPGGVPRAATVWMWKRMLELLGFVHRSGFVHGAILPAHVLVHAKDHGLVLAGWSRAGRAGAPLVARTEGADGFYPDDLASGGATRAAHDIAMSARVISRLLGGTELAPPASVPDPLRSLVATHAQLAPDMETDAWALMARVQEAANAIFGPPRFVRFDMPGWI
jgi:hypothetical protein